ncbi:beta-glucuronidase [Nibrella saemangeumensis]|uniref:beta-galactosidase n=1 Tax=Nibrella saemangeumensis TaxID=1084526 RepID=A0ABP8NU22_9BACT
MRLPSIRFFFTWLLLLPLVVQAAKPVIDLAGVWRFRMDPADRGIQDRWYTQKLPETIKLPGSMAENRKGNNITLQTQWTASIYDSSWYFNPRMAKYREPEHLKFPFWLTPAKEYVGPAWYQKEVRIPADWANKRIVLSLERPHTETRVWVDEVEIGWQNSMAVAHEYVLTDKLTPGSHTITIRIDNRIKEINVGKDSHSLTDHTQGNWNGIAGRLALRADDKIWIEDLQVYPNLVRKSVRIIMLLGNATPKVQGGAVTVTATSFNASPVHAVKPMVANVVLKAGETRLELEYPMGEDVQTWDEFRPALYRLTAELSSKELRHEKQVQFGMREFKAKGTRFEVNGRPVFLRGTVNNCEFPLTGYPAMDVPAWERIFKIAKTHGLNHMRFHSWCPPEAAFIAADKQGFYLQPEGPSWANHGTSLGDGKPIDKFIYDETNRMAKAYGNYASFCMLASGNEPAGRNQANYLGKFVTYWKAKDKRRVYTGASVGMNWPLVPENEFMVKSGPRGLPWDRQPQSTWDYRDRISLFPVPYVAHEMGQWCAYPNFKEIRKYTGVYRARNFELFREDLQDRGMGDQADDFLMASGKLQALSYKTEIETALRTPGMAGFQLLGLNDFPGQGTAQVGVLDAFWDEKGYISARQFSRFCNTTVPLARMSKFVYRNNEVFKADLEIAHFGPELLVNARISWTITDSQRKVLAKGAFDPKTLPIGNGLPVGSISLPLENIEEADKLKLEVTIDKTAFANDWDFWVYPANLPELPGTDVYVTTTLDTTARRILNEGGKVFLEMAGKVEEGKEVAQHFAPVFWNTSWFKMRPPHTLGILCNPKHPAFFDFPTDYHSDLQWWELVNRAQVMLLEGFPAGFRPLVQPIDTWFLNRRLGLVLEAKVGKGKLMVSSADLTSDLENRPVARQLRYSLLQYMRSDKFNPKAVVELAVIEDLFRSRSKETVQTYTKDSPDELKPKN